MSQTIQYVTQEVLDCAIGKVITGVFLLVFVMFVILSLEIGSEQDRKRKIVNIIEEYQHNKKQAKRHRAASHEIQQEQTLKQAQHEQELKQQKQQLKIQDLKACLAIIQEEQANQKSQEMQQLLEQQQQLEQEKQQLLEQQEAKQKQDKLDQEKFMNQLLVNLPHALSKVQHVQ